MRVIFIAEGIGFFFFNKFIINSREENTELCTQLTLQDKRKFVQDRNGVKGDRNSRVRCPHCFAFYPLAGLSYAFRTVQSIPVEPDLDLPAWHTGGTTLTPT